MNVTGFHLCQDLSYWPVQSLTSLCIRAYNHWLLIAPCSVRPEQYVRARDNETSMYVYHHRPCQACIKLFEKTNRKGQVALWCVTRFVQLGIYFLKLTFTRSLKISTYQRYIPKLPNNHRNKKKVFTNVRNDGLYNMI